MADIDPTPKHVSMHVPGPMIREVYVAPSPHFELSALIGVVDEVEDFIRQHGFRFQGRVARYVHGVRRSLLPKDDPRHIDPALPQFFGWVRELRQLHAITLAFSAQDPDAEYKRLMQCVLSGQETSSKSEDPTARNHQFHLYLTAKLRRVGYVATIHEPDIEVANGEWTFVIAAKRVKSAARLFRRISEGAAQIKKSGRTGIVALDLSEIAFPDCGRLTIGGEDGVALALNDELGRLLNVKRDQIMKSIDRSVVKAIVGHIDVVVETPQGWGNHSSLLTSYLVWPDDPWHSVFREMAARAGHTQVLTLPPRPDFVAGPVAGRWLSTSPGTPGVKLDEIKRRQVDNGSH